MASEDSASAAAAATAALGAEAREERIDFSQLHPSVRFYRGMWKLTQLTEGDEHSPPKADAASPSSRHDVLPASSSSSPASTATHSVAALSVVALHQQLLPPAPSNGLGEVADESYAAQLATSDGIELLRVHWHLLLPLLFPCSSCTSTHMEGEAIACLPVDKVTATQTCEEVFCNGKEGTAPESRWTPQELYTRVRRPLSVVDVEVVRVPGLMDRIYYSYIVLLRFFGWRVHDEERGLLDRNRAWAVRYALLEMYRAGGGVEEPSLTASSAGQLPPPPTYADFNFYADGLPRVLRGLLDVGFLRLAVRLLEFVMEEMKSDRLCFLLPLVEDTLLPLLTEHPSVEASHKTRLKRQLYRLTHSDSD
ncbi:hypothetical protein ABB37_00886 [Leptomonas pyrrhocoris]|uniref:Opioid growth factor receptor (OGFr) conserved domain-containing protein n=1 Tax=Leptomonas pyrrhocoris TaxID=157538 RepID=A0A0N0E0U0_LEPPY|nr:hypothetical protein ABB37_00886 [Leptomonas pyrrhocoris]XP_015665271.1 hypothetical protein ABB37_00886 [Leptomonas pyrrhocoris]KPA86831.1 hypothetical protein ABB37_00886 [Leptomonas pyrrhocoris]KPA86832.1 hypothetical protein ABB37_00886 [Leptomonas pyrrhocoris]|eukprot:XP_015665270.1 hypothetical protein ABB37_00886 [Leptomonas pyrrhocoris]